MHIHINNIHICVYTLIHMYACVNMYIYTGLVSRAATADQTHIDYYDFIVKFGLDAKVEKILKSLFAS